MTDRHNPAGQSQPVAGDGSADSRVLEEVTKALAGLRYGAIEIVVHDGRVTQIETRKKTRLS